MAHDVMAATSVRTNPTLRINRGAVFFFAALLLLSIPAFWPSYFAPAKPVTEPRIHVHGVLMFGWLALLIAQAALIRTGRRPLHRRLGQVSYVLVPLIVVSTLSVLHYRLNQKIFPEILYFLYVILSLTAVFVFAYAMAMANRKTPAIHARYMVCTALTLIDPIGARLLFNGLGIEPPAMQLITYGVIDALLAWLAWMDWKAGNGIRVFAVMLAVFVVVVEIPTFFIFRMPWWPDFARWLAALPMI